MSDEQFYNGIENYGFGELPDTMEDLVEAMEIIQTDINNISMQIEMRSEIGYDSEWLKRTIGAMSIKCKQRAILRGHKVWMEKEDKADEDGNQRAKLTGILNLLYKRYRDAHREAIALCKRFDAGFKE